MHAAVAVLPEILPESCRNLAGIVAGGSSVGAEVAIQPSGIAVFAAVVTERVAGAQCAGGSAAGGRIELAAVFAVGLVWIGWVEHGVCDSFTL